MKQKQRWVMGLLAAANISGMVAIGNVVAAEPTQKSNYVRVKAGVMQPASGFDHAGYDLGPDVGFAYGRYLSEHCLLEGAIESFAAERETKGTTLTTGSYTQENDIGVTALLLTLKGEYPAGPVNLSGGAGIGVYEVGLYSTIKSEKVGEFKADDNATMLGAHLTVGASYDLSQSFFIGIEGLYRWTEKVKIEKTAVSVPVTNNDNLDGYTVTAIIGYRF